MTFIGIDPGERTGLAVYDTTARRLQDVRTEPLHRALDIVRLCAKTTGGDLVVIFEDARQRKWLPQERSSAEYRGKLMGAGAAKRDAKIWEEFLTDHGIPFRMVPPRPGATKWSPERFGKLTGWTKRTSNHGRDAALLVYGMETRHISN